MQHITFIEWAHFSLEASVEPLMSAYYSLQQKDAALGVLEYAQKYLNMTLKESWCVSVALRS